MLRMQALSALAADDEADETIVRSALDAALADEDAGVRGQGIALLQEALSDGDETVRYRAASKLKEGGIASGKPE